MARISGVDLPREKRVEIATPILDEKIKKIILSYMRRIINFIFCF